MGNWLMGLGHNEHRAWDIIGIGCGATWALGKICFGNMALGQYKHKEIIWS